MMLKLFLILLIKIITINAQSDDQSEDLSEEKSLERLIGTEVIPELPSYEVFSPCENGILRMDRLTGKTNYWNGTIVVNKNYPNLTEALIVLRLKAAAILTVDPEEGRVLTSTSEDRIKVISFLRPNNGYETLKFKLQGRDREKFPNVLELKLNDLDICNNPREWEPSTQLTNTATIGDNTTKPIADNATEAIEDSSTEIIENNTSMRLTNAETTDDNAGAIPENKSNRVSSETCGQRKILYEGFITNGYSSIEGYWPWHAALIHLKGNSYEYVCGGTLLNTNTILTAAHCVTENGQSMIPARILVILGLYNRLLAGRNAQNFRPYKVIPHEEFDPNSYKNDIALILLATEVKFTSYVQPICLWSKDQADLQNVVNENGIVVGWGFTENKNEASDFLNQAKMPIVDTFTCLKSNRKFFGAVISEKNFCAGFKNGTSVCNGDSGGGMVFVRDNVYRIRGIVSLGPVRVDEKVCNPQEYIIFTDVAKYLDWIQNQIDEYN